jgi:hypothetical protein
MSTGDQYCKHDIPLASCITCDPSTIDFPKGYGMPGANIPDNPAPIVRTPPGWQDARCP